MANIEQKIGIEFDGPFHYLIGDGNEALTVEEFIIITYNKIINVFFFLIINFDIHIKV